jgi:hypothetical protein
MGALGAFEKDLFAGVAGLLKCHGHVGDIGFQPGGKSGVLVRIDSRSTVSVSRNFSR